MFPVQEQSGRWVVGGRGGKGPPRLTLRPFVSSLVFVPLLLCLHAVLLKRKKPACLFVCCLLCPACPIPLKEAAAFLFLPILFFAVHVGGWHLVCLRLPPSGWSVIPFSSLSQHSPSASEHESLFFFTPVHFVPVLPRRCLSVV